MSETTKQFTVVLESKGADKLELQFKAMQAAAAAMGGSVDSALSSVNTKTGTARQSFKVLTTSAIEFKTAMDQINRSLAATSPSLIWKDSKDRFKTALSSMKEQNVPQKPSEGLYTDAWKAANAARAEMARAQEAEEKASLIRRAKIEKDIQNANGRVIIDNFKAVEKEKTRIAQEEDAARAARFKASLAGQYTALNNSTALAKTTNKFGSGSFEVSSLQASMQEAAIRAKLQQQVEKIQSQFSSGNFGQKAADNRLTSAFAAAQKDITSVNSALEQHRKKLQEAEAGQSSFATRVIESIGIYRIFNATINTAIAGLASIPKVGIQLEQTTATLTAVFGSFGQAGAQIQFLNSEAERTGLKLEDLRRSYATFSASALLAGQSAATVQKIFQDVNTTATTLHLTTDQVNGVFLALSQMFNKGKVQAEELTKQLSQTLPGITNQAAKALGMSAAQLGEEMKKGLVTADGAVQKMMARMAEAFGGEAFKRASSNLNAELGRLATSWTHFAENMYKASEGAMTSVVRSSTSTVNALSKITDNAYETERAFSKMAAGGVILAAAALGNYAGKAIAATETMIALKTGTLAFETVAARFAPTAILLGLAAITAAAWDTVTATKSALQHVKDLQDAKNRKTPEEKLKFDISKDTEVQRYTGEIQQLTEAAARAGTKKFPGMLTKEDYAVNIQVLKTALAEREKVLTEDAAKTVEATKKTFEGLDLSSYISESEIGVLEKAGKTREAAVARARQANLADTTKLKEERAKAIEAMNSGDLSSEDWKKAGAQIENIDKILQGFEEHALAAGDKIKEKGAAGVLKATYTDLATSLQGQRNDIVTSLDALSEKYAENTVSISEYYSKRASLIHEDFVLQKQVLTDQLAIAKTSGDIAKTSQINLELKKLEGAESQKLSKDLQDEAKAFQSLSQTMADVNGQYQNMLGKAAGGEAYAAFADKNKKKIADLMQEYAGGNQNAGASLEQLGALSKYALAVDSAASSVSAYSVTKQNLAFTEERIQNSLKIGAITEMDALYQTQEARTKAIEVMKAYVAEQERALAGAPGTSAAVMELKRVQEELRVLEGQANAFSDKFTSIFEQNFGSAFASFVQGTMTAKQAFQSFASGVIKNLAEIAAQQMAKELFGGVLKLFGGALLGGAVGEGGTGLSAGGSAADISAFMAANGAVTTGLSSVSGGLLTKPTLFPNAKVIPFASGGVLAGEAGAEGVFPLTRGSNGKLGIKATGSGSSVINNITVNVSKSGGESDQAFAAKLAEMIATRVARQEIANAARPGNINNRVTTFS